MSITPEENEKFESIVAGFEVTDASAVKQMERKDKASEMTFIPLPDLSKYRVTLAQIFLILAYATVPAALMMLALGYKDNVPFVGGLAFLFMVFSFLLLPKRRMSVQRPDSSKE